jgi:RNA polymerase sigma factor (sigma-70 family)
VRSRAPDRRPDRTFRGPRLTYLQTHAAADDADLVAVALQGVPGAFGQIIQRYKDAVFGVALSRSRNFHDAEDLTQETFLEAYAGLEGLREPARLGAWLRTIAIHRSINLVKRRQASVDLDAVAELPGTALSPQEEVESVDLRERVLRTIGRLGKTHRETVTLFYVREVHDLLAGAGPEGLHGEAEGFHSTPSLSRLRTVSTTAAKAACCGSSSGLPVTCAKKAAKSSASPVLR